VASKVIPWPWFCIFQCLGDFEEPPVTPSVSNLAFPEPETRVFGYFLLPETRVFSTTKPGYFKNPGIAIAFKY